MLLQHRAEWSHHGGTWGLLGGARHADEAPVATALREAAEEAGLHADAALVSGEYDDDHGGWSYCTVVAVEVGDAEARPTSAETVEVRWWPVSSLPELSLHPGFAATWPVVRDALQPLTVVVDAANVVGSRPDGWWKDRAGAARRLVDDVAAVCSVGRRGRGTPARRWPGLPCSAGGRSPWSSSKGPPGPLPNRWTATQQASACACWPHRARATTPSSLPWQRQETVPIVVVTADRELRARCEALGAVAAGPRWLRGLIDAARGTSG